MNISSILVIPQPQMIDSLPALLAEIDGVRIAATAADGRIIATIEAANDGATIETYELISRLDGLLSVAMVYHHKEDEPDAVIDVGATGA
jgi:nitrate reductase NapD